MTNYNNKWLKLLNNVASIVNNDKIEEKVAIIEESEAQFSVPNTNDMAVDSSNI
jgi:hypothetical protein